MNIDQYRLIFIILILIGPLSLNAKGRDDKILHCLAREETKFHKTRETGPEFTLNQKLINKLSSIGHYRTSPYAIKSVCRSKKRGPAQAFLRMLILEPDSIFLEDKNSPESMKALNRSAINSLKAEASKLLFEFLSDIQSLAGDAKCIEAQIPEVKYFWDRFRYLETYIGTGSIVDDPDKIDQIFEKLTDINKVLRKCNKENPRR